MTDTPVLKTAEEHGVPLVLFSGGLDSTYALYRALHEYEQVDVVIGSLESQYHKNLRETKATGDILDALFEIPESETFGRISTLLRIPTMGTYSRGRPSLQPLSWFYAAAGACCSETTSEVIMGYVRGDSWEKMYDRLTYTWDYITSLCGVTGFKGKRPELSMPLIGTTKAEILLKLPPHLAALTSWCESQDEGNDCGICQSCTRMLTESLSLKYFHPKEYESLSILPRLQAMHDRFVANLNKRTQDHPKNPTQTQGDSSDTGTQ